MKSHKQPKAEAIAQCVQLIAIHYKVEPTKLVCPHSQSRLSAVLDARKVLCYHLHHCGMSYESIAKLIHRTTEKAQLMARQGQFKYLSERHKPMMDRLPRIPMAANPPSSGIAAESKF